MKSPAELNLEVDGPKFLAEGGAGDFSAVAGLGAENKGQEFSHRAAAVEGLDEGLGQVPVALPGQGITPAFQEMGLGKMPGTMSCGFVAIEP